MKGKRYSVDIAEHAKLDLVEIGLYYLENAGEAKALEITEALENKCESLRRFPFRGHAVPELADIGVTDYLEVHMEDYRIIYSVKGRNIDVLAVLDGQRDIETILMLRLAR